MASLHAKVVKKKDSGAIEAMKILCPLAEEVFDEVLPTKYKRTKFSSMMELRIQGIT